MADSITLGNVGGFTKAFTNGAIFYYGNILSIVVDPDVGTGGKITFISPDHSDLMSRLSREQRNDQAIIFDNLSTQDKTVDGVEATDSEELVELWINDRRFEPQPAAIGAIEIPTFSVDYDDASVADIDNEDVLMFLFRAKAGTGGVKVRRVSASYQALTADDYAARIHLLPQMDHTFVDANFQDVDPLSGIEFARPGLNSVPAKVVRTGYFAGGRQVWAEYGAGDLVFNGMADSEVNLPELVTYGFSMRSIGINAEYRMSVNFGEL